MLKAKYFVPCSHLCMKNIIFVYAITTYLKYNSEFKALHLGFLDLAHGICLYKLVGIPGHTMRSCGVKYVI